MEDFKRARELMPEQVAVIDAEVKQAQALAKVYEKEQLKKYSGFFTKLDKA